MYSVYVVSLSISLKTHDKQSFAAKPSDQTEEQRHPDGQCMQ